MIMGITARVGDVILTANGAVCEFGRISKKTATTPPQLSYGSAISKGGDLVERPNRIWRAIAYRANIATLCVWCGRVGAGVCVWLGGVSMFPKRSRKRI